MRRDRLRQPLRSFLRIIISSFLIAYYICRTKQPFFINDVQAATVSRQYGDVNWDGQVDSGDRLLIDQHIAASTVAKIGKEHPDWVLFGDDFKVADVNCDGRVDSRDRLRVSEYNAAARVPKIRSEEPNWYNYLRRYYRYNATLKPSTTKITLNLNGTKSYKMSVTRNYGRHCYLTFKPIGKKPKTGIKFNGWDKAKKTFTFTLIGNTAEDFSFRVNLYDLTKKTYITCTDVINVKVVNKSSSNSKYKKYNLSNDQLKRIARLCQQEQGTVKGAKAEASLMANQLETSKARQKKYGTGANGLYRWVRYGGWFAKAAYWMDHGTVSPQVLAGVKDVLVNGNRVLPLYIDEHDCLSDIKSISTGKPKNKNQYIKGKTIVRNKQGARWTFWCFPDGRSDPFGYTEAAYKAATKK